MLKNFNNSIRRYFKCWKLIDKDPYILYRLLLNYYNLVIFKKRILKKIEIALTFDCQCKCDKCASTRMINHAQPKLSKEQLKKIAYSCRALGVVKVNFSGGEPLLFKDIFEIIHFFRSQKLMVSINTNGLLLNKVMIRRLRDAGAKVLNISLDSPYRDEHDASRGSKGCFGKVMEALQIIKETEGIRAQISVVAVRKILYSERIDKLLALAKQYKCFLALTIPSRCGNWSGTNEIITEKRDRETMECLDNHPMVVTHTNVGYFSSYCPAGFEQLYITCYGDVTPCPFIQISFGNIKEKELKDIWLKVTRFKAFVIPSKVCLSGQDSNFIETFLDPLQKIKVLPVRAEDHPSLI